MNIVFGVNYCILYLPYKHGKIIAARKKTGEAKRKTRKTIRCFFDFFIY